MVVKRKVVLLGDGAVGKTSLISRFVLNKFDEKYIMTIGVRVSKKKIEIVKDGKRDEVDLIIWDVLGQSGFDRVKKLSLQGTQAALLVCDLTRRETLKNLEEYWYNLIKKSIGNVPVIVLANKKDLPNWEFDEGDVKKVAERLKSPYFLTSAKTGEFVNESFRMIAEMSVSSQNGILIEDEWIRVKNLKDVVDFIMEDFSKTYGSVEDAMPILRHQITMANLDVENPKVENVEKFINQLYTTEKDFLGNEKAKENKLKRMEVLRKLKSWQESQMPH